jgi:ribosome modulation factor
MSPQVQYTMQLQSRVLVPMTSQRSRSQWLVGSTSLRDDNEVRAAGGETEGCGPARPHVCTRRRWRGAGGAAPPPPPARRPAAAGDCQL